MKNPTLTPELYDFIVEARTHHAEDLLTELTAETAKLGSVSGMQIAPEQGTFLSLMVAALGARNALEIGTFTGSSSLAIARGLPADGHLLCLDMSGEWTAIAQKYWQQAGLDGKIELRLGDARQTVLSVTGPLDFVFIDADKGGYDTYYEAVLPHVRANGVIIFDNMLRHGNVVNPQNEDDHALRDLNLKLAKDTRVEAVLVPIADGLNIVRKL